MHASIMGPSLQSTVVTCVYMQYGLWFTLVFQYFFYVTHAMSIITGTLRLGYEYVSVDELFLLNTLLLIVEGIHPKLLVYVIMALPHI